jgi:hypothetical protein
MSAPAATVLVTEEDELNAALANMYDRLYYDTTTAREFARNFLDNIAACIDLELEKMQFEFSENRSMKCARNNFEPDEEWRVSIADWEDQIIFNIRRCRITSAEYIKAVKIIRDEWRASSRECYPQLFSTSALDSVQNPVNIEGILFGMLNTKDHTISDFNSWMFRDMCDALCDPYAGVADLEAVVMKNAVAHEQHARVNDHCIPDLRNIVMDYLGD